MAASLSATEARRQAEAEGLTMLPGLLRSESTEANVLSKRWYADAKPSRMALVLQLCTVLLLTVIMALLAALLGGLALVANNVTPLVRSVDPDTFTSFIGNATNGMAALSSFSNQLHFQLLPSSIPGLVTTIMSINVAPAADSIQNLATHALTSLASYKPTSEGEADFVAALMSTFSVLSSAATVLASWKPPPASGDADEGESASASWPEELIFGTSVFTWLKDQGNITTLHKLGDACASDHDQIQKLHLPGFEFDLYTARQVYRRSEFDISITHEKKFPFQAESVSNFLDHMEKVCKAIQQASPDSEQGAAALALP